MKKSNVITAILSFYLSIAPSFAIPALAAPLLVAPVRLEHGAEIYQADGVVEAVRQSVISAQVSGAITVLPVKAGDAIRTGQLLARIDARAAQQEAAASRAQVESARATLNTASKDLERQKQLFAKNFISQAQLDRAESQFLSASAQANALIAQAGASQTQSGFYTLSAPYNGFVTDVSVAMGDMALPGRPLMTIYDPSAMRIVVTLPQAMITQLTASQSVEIEFPGQPEAQRRLSIKSFRINPMTDAASHTVQIRLDVPSNVTWLTPGLFARASFQINRGNNNAGRLYIPKRSLVKRAEIFAVYVVNPQGKPLLRQIKLGNVTGDEQEILAGLSVGEQVALEPLMAAQFNATK